MEAEAALGVAGRVDDLRLDAANPDMLQVGRRVVGWFDGWSLSANPCGLHVHHRGEWEVGRVVDDGCAGDLLELERAGDVVDMRVSDDDLTNGQLMLRERRQNPRDLIAGIDDDCFTRLLVAKDRAVALEQA